MHISAHIDFPSGSAVGLESPVQTDDMAMTKAEKEWVGGEIAKSRRYVNVAVTLGVVAIVLGMLYQTFGHRDQEQAFQTKTDTAIGVLQASSTRTEAQLTSIQSQLVDLRVALAQNVLAGISSLGPKEFAASLPELKRAIEKSPNEARPTSEQLRQLRVKLAGTPQTTPDYWPVAFAFLRFAFVAAAPRDVPPPGSTPSFPTTRIEDGQFSNTTVLLDNASVTNTVFMASRIRFTNRPSRLVNVSFINCVFEFPETSTPPPHIKAVVGQLLASSSLANVKLSTS